MVPDKTAQRVRTPVGSTQTIWDPLQEQVLTPLGLLVGPTGSPNGQVCLLAGCAGRKDFTCNIPCQHGTGRSQWSEINSLITAGIGPVGLVLATAQLGHVRARLGGHVGNDTWNLARKEALAQCKVSAGIKRGILVGSSSEGMEARVRWETGAGAQHDSYTRCFQCPSETKRSNPRSSLP